MRPSLVAVLALSLVGLSGAAMSDGMPAAKKHHYSKVKKTKVVKHRHGPQCPPGHDDDSWAIAEQLNHEEWLRHRQDDLGRRGGEPGDDDISRYDDRYARDYAARDEDVEAWDGREADDAELLREAEAEGFRRDRSYQGTARRYVDKRVYQRHSAEGRGHGWTGGDRGWGGTGHRQVERRVYRSQGGAGHGADFAWGDFDRFGGGGHVERRIYRSSGGGYSQGGQSYAGGYGEEVYAGGSRDFDERTGGYRHDDRRYGDDEVYAGGSRDFDERTGRYEAPRHERRVIVTKRYGGGHGATRYSHRDDYAGGGGHGYGGGYSHGGGYGYAGGGSGHAGGYASSSYSSSSYGSSGHGYGEGGGYGYGRGGGYRFHYDAGYSGRDEGGYLTWPGKAG